MRYLSGNDLLSLASPVALIAAMEAALRAFAANQVRVPERAHLSFGDNTLLTMPVVGEDAFGAKIVSVVPANAKRGLPVIQGLMTLSDGATGVPLAVLDAAMLTAQRTGAVGALGLKYISPPDVDRIGLIGTGVQGIWQTVFACAVRPIRTVYFVARSDEKAQYFVQAVSRHVQSVSFSRCRTVTELLAQVEVVIAATTSSDPIVPAERGLLEKKHFMSVGSFNPSMQELPNLVYELAKEPVIDSGAAKSEVGDLIQPLSLGLIREEDVIHLTELVTGKRSVDTDRTTVFKSVGMALYDLYAARTFLTEAQRLGRGTLLDS